MNVTEFLASRPGRVILALARTVFWSTAAALLLALCRRGLTLGDEGYLISQASDLLAGKVPYRDFDLFVTPGAWYLIAGLFSFTGPSVLATRIAAAACVLGTMLLTRRIVRASGGPLWADLGAALIPVFTVWAWPAWSFSFYSPWATLAAMASLACALDWMRSRRGGWLVACGVSLGLTIAFKQNYGVFAAAGCAAALLLDEIAVAPAGEGTVRSIAGRFVRAALLTALGGALVLVPLVAWLAQQGALPAAFDSLVLRPFHGFVDAHSIAFLDFGDLWRRTQMWAKGGFMYMAVPVTATGLRFSWPGAAVSLVEILHVALYWVPVFAFAGFGVQGLRRLRREPSAAERALLAVTVFAAAFFLGVFPRADYNHLINVYPPVLAMLASGAAVYLGQGRWRRDALHRAAAGLAALSLLCFAGVSAVWMNSIRKNYWIPVDSPRAGVLVEPLVAEELNHEIALLRGMTAENEPVFALPGLSMIPFLAERPMPTRYYNYYSVHIGHDGGLEAAREIERSGARVILSDYSNFFSDPTGMIVYGSELADYLKRRFRPATTLSLHSRMILLRREEPVDNAASREIFIACELRGGGTPGRYVVENLFFRSLYHSYRGAWGTRNERLTVCQIQVPTAARFRVGLDLRQPAPALEPATVRAQVWVLPNRGRARRLLEHEWTLASEISGSQDAGGEFEVDLARWQGQVVTILLRTLVEGEIPPDLADMNGLSVMWNDASIESPDYEGIPGFPGW